MKEWVSKVEQRGVTLRAEDWPAIPLLDEPRGIKHDARKGSDHLWRRGQPQCLVDELLPVERDRMPEAETTTVIRPHESRSPGSDPERDLQCAPKALRVEVQLRGDVRKMGSTIRLIRGQDRRIPGDLGPAPRPRCRPIQIAPDGLHSFAVDETPLEGCVEQLADRSQVFSHRLDLADHVAEEGEIGIVVRGEVMNDHVSSLAVAIQPAVALLEAS